MSLELRKTILVVDDEAAIRALLSSSLQRSGFHPLQAGAAPEALALVEDSHQPIDALVCDVVMPGMDGPQLARRLCAVRPGLKVILISGYSEKPPALEPDWVFLAKPFSPAALCRKLRSLVGERELHA